MPTIFTLGISAVCICILSVCMSTVMNVQVHPNCAAWLQEELILPYPSLHEDAHTFILTDGSMKQNTDFKRTKHPCLVELHARLAADSLPGRQLGDDGVTTYAQIVASNKCLPTNDGNRYVTKCSDNCYLELGYKCNIPAGKGEEAAYKPKCGDPKGPRTDLKAVLTDGWTYTCPGTCESKSGYGGKEDKWFICSPWCALDPGQKCGVPGLFGDTKPQCRQGDEPERSNGGFGSSSNYMWTCDTAPPPTPPPPSPPPPPPPPPAGTTITVVNNLSG